MAETIPFIHPFRADSTKRFCADCGAHEKAINHQDAPKPTRHEKQIAEAEERGRQDVLRRVRELLAEQRQACQREMSNHFNDGMTRRIYIARDAAFQKAEELVKSLAHAPAEAGTAPPSGDRTD